MSNFISKKDARAHFSLIRSSISLEERQRKSEAVIRSVSALSEFDYCDTLFLYSPIKSELNVLPLFDLAKQRGIRVAFPISIKESSTLDFRYVSSFDELSLGAYNILEPEAKAKKAIFSKHSICIVPALAFDKSGNRLGYGKGFYDRFLKQFTGLSVGVTFSELLCDALPADGYDIPVNVIITDKESVKFK